MKEITQIENERVEIWRRPRQKHMRLTVRPNGSLRVTCAMRVPKRAIVQFLADSRVFIARTRLKLGEQRAHNPSKRFVSDEVFYYFGAQIPLQLIWSWNRSVQTSFFASHIEMLAPVSSTPAERRAGFLKAFRAHALERLSERFEHFARLMQAKPSRLVLRGQTSRWGSCSARGEISLNYKLLAVPADVQDYVIVHELAHLEHMNHGPHFWNLVRRYCPEFETHKRWLRAHDRAIALQFEKPASGEAGALSDAINGASA